MNKNRSSAKRYCALPIIFAAVLNYSFGDEMIRDPDSRECGSRRAVEFETCGDGNVRDATCKRRRSHLPSAPCSFLQARSRQQHWPTISICAAVQASSLTSSVRCQSDRMYIRSWLGAWAEQQKEASLPVHEIKCAGWSRQFIESGRCRNSWRRNTEVSIGVCNPTYQSKTFHLAEGTTVGSPHLIGTGRYSHPYPVQQRPRVCATRAAIDCLAGSPASFGSRQWRWVADL